ncbi:MAG: hypothetical protein ACRDDX_13395 [Cellulosilyticaceae bacterium]
MKQNCELFACGDSCTWIVLLVGAYFFLSNGCLGNIFDQCDNSIIWIIILFFVLYMFNQNNAGCGCGC